MPWSLKDTLTQKRLVLAWILHIFPLITVIFHTRLNFKNISRFNFQMQLFIHNQFILTDLINTVWMDIMSTKGILSHDIEVTTRRNQCHCMKDIMVCVFIFGIRIFFRTSH